MRRKVLLVVMDGIGIANQKEGDILKRAETPVLDWLLRECPSVQLKAHGTAVGLPSDEDMGNSEVGHNALGCGQIYSQGAKLVNKSIETEEIYKGATWNELIKNCENNNTTLHFIGLLSDGNVHSNISHLISMIKEAKKSKVNRVRIHVLLDGRDVPSKSALKYIQQLEEVLNELNDGSFEGKIASGGGRMVISMDRYGSDWNMVKQGWDTHVRGIGRQFKTATEAIETYRQENRDLIDQYMPPFIIEENNEPIGKIIEKDSVILFNFRGDRAIELSKAFEEEEFHYFDRGPKLEIMFAGMLQYDGDLKIPYRFLVSPPHITNTLSEVLIDNKITQYAISETQKYGHITYFWNGNRSQKFNDNLETFVEIPSDNVEFDQRPWMKSAEITDCIIEKIEEKQFDFIRCNFPNGDMVGHTGNLNATVIAVEAVDLALGRLLPICRKNDVIMIITADHGNVDEMYENNSKQIKTAHSLNKVPFIIYDPKNERKFKEGEYGLANVAPTIAKIFEVEVPECWEVSMI